MSLTSYRLDREGADRLLFLIHGWSAEQHHLAAYVPLIDPDERFTAICPRGIHDLPEGDGASWYDRTDAGPDPTSFRHAVTTLQDFIAQEASAAGVPLDQCVVGGFSQGGFLAQAIVGASDAPRYAGVWTMCCGVPEVEGVTIDFSGGDDRPALVQYGSRDAIIPEARTKAIATSLGDNGWKVRLEGYDMAHSQTIEMMVDAREWLATVSTDV